MRAASYAPRTGIPVTSVVFDLDGTLVDSIPGILASLSVAFQAADRIMPQGDFRSAIGPPIRVIARRIEPTLTDAELDRIEPAFRANYDNCGWRHTILFEHVGDSLRELHAAGLRLFVLTNKPHLPTASILSQFQLQPLIFDTISRDSRSPAFATKAEMLGALMERHHLAPDSTLMVGDTVEDQEAAHANHLQFLFASYGYGSIKEAPLVIDHFSQLSTFLSIPTFSQDSQAAR